MIVDAYGHKVVRAGRYYGVGLTNNKWKILHLVACWIWPAFWGI